MDYAPNATGRYKLTYVAAGVQHVLVIRQPRGTSHSSMLINGNTLMESLFDDLHLNMPVDVASIGVETMEEDGVFWTPHFDLPALTAGAHPLSDYSPVQKITSTTFPGKSTGGSKGRIVLYGYFVEWDDSGTWSRDGNIFSAEDPRISAAIATLNLTGSLVGIDDTPMVWYQKATIKVNDFLLRLVRRGIVE